MKIPFYIDGVEKVLDTEIIYDNDTQQKIEFYNINMDLLKKASLKIIGIENGHVIIQMGEISFKGIFTSIEHGGFPERPLFQYLEIIGFCFKYKSGIVDPLEKFREFLYYIRPYIKTKELYLLAKVALTYKDIPCIDDLQKDIKDLFGILIENKPAKEVIDEYFILSETKPEELLEEERKKNAYNAYENLIKLDISALATIMETVFLKKALEITYIEDKTEEEYILSMFLYITMETMYNLYNFQSNIKEDKENDDEYKKLLSRSKIISEKLSERYSSCSLNDKCCYKNFNLLDDEEGNEKKASIELFNKIKKRYGENCWNKKINCV